MTQGNNWVRVEAEAARLVGVTAARQGSGYSGTGYVTGFTADDKKVIFAVTVSAAGIYDVRIGFRTPSGEKGYVLVVNGARLSGMFPRTGDRFSVHSAGKVELRTGANEIAIEKGWGYFDIDYLEVAPSPRPAPLRKPSPVPTDAKATPVARALLRYLTNQYGAKTLSGQYDLPEAEYVRAATGKLPAILGGDFIEYSPSRREHGANPNGLTEKYIGYARQGYVLTFSWHWNAPSGLLDKTYTDNQGKTVDARWYKGFYTNATTFDLQRALADPNGADYRLLLRDIDVIAAELKKLAAAGVPVLWRPLHEAEGGWFWWGAKGPEPFIRLWRLLHNRLTGYHNLHNLLWVFTHGSKADWYPGDAYVDIVGVDAYPADVHDPLSGDWESLRARFEGKKLLALTEFGGVPDIERMYRYGVRWSYFVSWTGDLGPHKVPKTDLIRIYSASAVINRGALPRWGH